MPHRFGICRQSALKYKHSDSMHGTSHYTIRGSIDREHCVGQKCQKVVAAEAQRMLKNKEDYV